MKPFADRSGHRNAKKQNGCLTRPYKIAVKRREVKSKGEKERYKHLNTEFQRIARRDKKAFLSDQCKEIEKNNRMGKTRDCFIKKFTVHVLLKPGLENFEHEHYFTSV